MTSMRQVPKHGGAQRHPAQDIHGTAPFGDRPSIHQEQNGPAVRLESMGFHVKPGGWTRSMWKHKAGSQDHCRESMHVSRKAVNIRQHPQVPSSRRVALVEGGTWLATGPWLGRQKWDD